MPIVKEYQSQGAPSGGFDNTQASPEAFAVQGRAFSQLGGAISDVGEILDKRNQMNELSDANAKMSELQANYTNRLTESAAAGDFDTEKFLSDYRQDVDKLSENYSTQQAQNFIKTTSGNTQQHLSTSAVATQVELSSVKFKENSNNSLKFIGDAVYRDPHGLDVGIANFNAYIDSVSAGNKRTAKAALAFKASARATLAERAVAGIAAINPQQAIDDLKAGKFDSYELGTKKIDELIDHAHDMQRAQDADVARQDRLQEKAEKKAQEVELNKIYSAIITDDPSITAKSIAENPILTGEMKKAAVIFMKTDHKKQASDDAKDLFASLADRARLPDGDPRKVYGASDYQHYSEAELPLTYRLQLTKIINDLDSPEGKRYNDLERKFLDSAKEEIAGTDQLGRMKDAQGKQKYVDFTVEYYKKKDELRKAGVPIDEMYRSDGKNSLYPMIKTYKSSFQEKMQSQLNSFQNTKAPRPVDTTGKPKSATDILKEASQKATK